MSATASTAAAGSSPEGGKPSFYSGLEVIPSSAELIAVPPQPEEKVLPIYTLKQDPEEAEAKKPPPLKRVNTKDINIEEHLWTCDQLMEKYGTHFDVKDPESSKGLDSGVAADLLIKNGKNVLSPPKPLPLWKRYLKQYQNPLTLLILFAGILSFILFFINTGDLVNLYLGSIIVAVILLNTTAEFVQAEKGANVLNSFKNLIPTNAFVYRSGVASSIPAADLVVGDIVQVKEGDRVPADIRLFWCHHSLKVDNSSLTGESEPQKRLAEAEHKEPLEAENLAFSGTTINAGHGYGVVIRCGDKTTLGQIANLAGGGDVFEDETLKKKSHKSPLEEEVESFVRKVAFVSIGLAVLFFTIGMIIYPNFARNFIFLIGILLANVPQGLPSTVTLLLTYAVKKLAKVNVLVKDLQGIDTLGSITVLASDKTGTITQNRMTVVNIWIKKRFFSAHHSTSKPDIPEVDLKNPTGQLIIQLACLCSRARFEESKENMALPVEKRKINGDATESGLLRFAANNSDVQKMYKDFPVAFELPFTTHTKWALTIHRLSPEQDPDNSYLILMKGAPERVFANCARVMEDEKSLVDMSPAQEKSFDTAYKALASQGQRVLSMAFLHLKRDKFPDEFAFGYDADMKLNFPFNQLNFLGLIALMDPPKPGVADAIQKCRTAGIKVMMLTGDHPFTAEAIAKNVGLILGKTKEDVAKETGRPLEDIRHHEYDAAVVHGDKLANFTNGDWDAVLSKPEIVFARMTPLHKLEIVARCQANGHIVAVTGDGVNDSPALKRADLGISMGITGSDVSKAAAKMILLDDNFVTVVQGIEQGRLIFENLKKSIMYTLTHIGPTMFPFILFIVAGLPIAFNSILNVFLELGTELFPALSLAWEPKEEVLMKVPPRKHVKPVDILLVPEEEAQSLSRVPSFVLSKAPKSLTKKPKQTWTEFFLNKIWKDPSKPKRHKDDAALVDRHVLIFSYFQSGLIEIIGCFLGFFAVMSHNGIPFVDTWGLARNVYQNSKATDGTIAGRSFTGEELDSILREANSIYFITIVIGQFGTLLACKSLSGVPSFRRLLKNPRTYLAMVASLGYAAFVIYVPFMQGFSGSGPFPPIYYVIPVGTAITVFIVEMIKRVVTKSLQARAVARRERHFKKPKGEPIEIP